AEQGDRDRARDHFPGLLSTSMLNRDERAVVRAKLDRLESGRPGHSAQPPDLTNLAVHQGLSIELVPINEPPALVSTPAVCAPHLVATRRVAIQALSTTGSMMGFMRQTRLDCPLAYPNDLRQFQLKASALCDSTITQRDALLREVAGPSVPVTPERRAEIEKVYRAYYFE